jgi:hypothetical protein
VLGHDMVYPKKAAAIGSTNPGIASPGRTGCTGRPTHT